MKELVLERKNKYWALGNKRRKEIGKNIVWKSMVKQKEYCLPDEGF